MQFIAGIEADGETAWFDAIEAAMMMDGNAEAIFFLTDGVPTVGKVVAPPKIVQAVIAENLYRRITLHTVGLGVDGRAKRFLATLAEENGGRFRSIGVEAAGQETLIKHDPEKFAPRVVFRPSKPPLQRMRPFSAASASRKLRGDELVLGVVVDGVARAYPLNMLTGPDREIINDVLSDTPIAVTWCHLCHHGAVFRRRVGELTLVFSVSGMLWSENLVMLDNNTKSAWSQIYGKAMQGRLEGTQLERLPATITEWSEWKRIHPDSTALMMSRTVEDYDRSIYLRLKDYVVGTEIGGLARSWPLDLLEERRVVNDEIDGQPIVVVFDVASNTPFIYRRMSGETELSFRLHNGILVDDQTESEWDLSTGQAVAGPSKNTQLTPVPASLFLRKTWLQYYPGGKLLEGNH
jgi:hypothetical protein